MEACSCDAPGCGPHQCRRVRGVCSHYPFFFPDSWIAVISRSLAQLTDGLGGPLAVVLIIFTRAYQTSPCRNKHTESNLLTKVKNTAKTLDKFGTWLTCTEGLTDSQMDKNDSLSAQCAINAAILISVMIILFLQHNKSFESNSKYF